MSKTLVVSDNEILNQLYLINLEVYLATEVVLVLSIKEAKELLERGDRFDLIITMSMIAGQDAVFTISSLVIKINLSTPILVIGKPLREIPGVIVVQSSYNLKNLLRHCAEVLGVTSKSMASLVLPEFYPVSIKSLMKLKVAPCSIFLQVKKGQEEESYSMVAKMGSKIDEVLKKFYNLKISSLYVNKLDRLLVVNQVSSVLSDYLKNSDTMDMNEKSDALEAGFDFVASDFCHSEEAAKEVMSIANSCTKMMEEIGQETPGLKSLIQLLNNNKNGYIYSHSILSSFVASHIIKKVSWGGEGHLEKINFVLFFHDIMLAPIYADHPHLKYEEDLLYSEELSEKEKETVLNHARLAAQLITTYRRTPMGADLLIKQHHGMTNGMGFAVDFKDDISPLSKIVIIAEAFVEEYMRAKDADAQSQVDFKKIIQILNEKFKKSTYRKIIVTLETIKL